MKFSCDKYVLQQAAASAARAAAAKSPIPTLEGLLIEAGASVRKSSSITLVVSTGVPEVVETPTPNPTAIIYEDGTIYVPESSWTSLDGKHEITQHTDGTMWNELGQQCDSQGNPLG